jgi:hypothetical protein
MNLRDVWQWRFPKEFRIWRRDLNSDISISTLSAAAENVRQSAGREGLELKQQCRLICEIATELWRLKTKMTDSEEQPKQETRKIFRHVAAGLDVLSEVGVEVQNHTGLLYRSGLSVETLAFQPTTEVARETVIETIRPSVYLNNRQIQQGQVIVGTPLNKE